MTCSPCRPRMAGVPAHLGRQPGLDSGGLAIGLAADRPSLRRGDGASRARGRIGKARRPGSTASCRQIHARALSHECLHYRRCETGSWEMVIGLEVHAQVIGQARNCSPVRRPAYGGEPNTNVSLVDAALPGMLPVTEPRYCVEQAVKHRPRVWRAEINRLMSRVRAEELFLRRPAAGLPDQPVCPPDRRRRRTSRSSCRRRDPATIGVTRLHLEQDAGKSLHDQDATEALVHRPEPLRRGADGDRVGARHALTRGGRRPICASCAPSCAISAPATATWRKAPCAAT